MPRGHRENGTHGALRNRQFFKVSGRVFRQEELEILHSMFVSFSSWEKLEPEQEAVWDKIRWTMQRMRGY